MRLVFKEDPKAWRKQALLTLLGLGVITVVLGWRHKLTHQVCGGVLAMLALAVVGAAVRPRWFRGYYRLSIRLGFYFSKCIGCIVLAVLFVLIVTPLGLVLRLAGKDPLQIRRPRNAATYWNPGKEFGPLDRMF
jgi:Saxitoxin biosynthesis operon protein SxtJ